MKEEQELLWDDVLGQEEETEFVEVVGEPVEQDRLFLTTPFEEYTVSEGLLLMILLLAVVMICVKMVKGGFFWL